MQTCQARLDSILARIAMPGSQAAAIFTDFWLDEARAGAAAADRRLRQGRSLGVLDGRIVSIKALFDTAGDRTLAGSPLLVRRTPAQRDATVIQRLRGAGAVIIGKTQMTELAFSGLGLNRHAEELGNPAHPAYVTGGSSSGAAASVAAGLAEIAIGSDTGGSVRIPASLCGLVGFKPTAGQIPTEGAFPLSTTLDCIGPLASTVDDCAAAYMAMAGPANVGADIGAVRLVVARGRLTDGLDAATSQGFEDALIRLKHAVTVTDGSIEAELDALAELDGIGAFTVPELLATLADIGIVALDGVDPMIRLRLDAARDMTAVAYVRLQRHRAVLVARMDRTLAGGDVLVLPTVPVTAPTRAAVSEPHAALNANAILIRNARPANLFDLPAITLPLPVAGMPVGLTMMCRRGDDERLLAIARQIEAILH